ncbi:ELWxxDGT repeat protein [Pyxidicoccus trucidator]|uniref:ELWxxDGT repeat protein n=1 Tax=Pyxidicoccus trucidator TaxID=2709662 RepID=UPI0013DB53B8|nr:ELWxxDGT repeat protein [Pyxidicoccus trucidator]
MNVGQGLRALLGASLAACLGMGCAEEKATKAAPESAPREHSAALVGTPFQVRDLLAGTGPDVFVFEEPTMFAALGNTVLFGASDKVHGQELWRTDGTAGGTSMVVDLLPGYAGSAPSHSLVMNGRLYFLAASTGAYLNGLWSSDGTAQGTVLVKSLRAQGSFLTQRNGVLYIGTTDSESPSSGFSLWKSDGTPEGTVLLRREHASSGTVGWHPHAWLGDTLLFAATDDTRGMALWKSDGTPAGTTRVMQNPPPFHSLHTGGLTECGGKVLFWAAREFGRNSLWRTDGTDSGTVLLKDIDTADPSSPGAQFPPQLFCFGGTFYFSAWDAEAGRELWKSDGTTDGTVRMADLAPGTEGSFPGTYTPHGGAFYFWAWDASAGHELWKSDGTPQGTSRVADLAPGIEWASDDVETLTMISSPVGLFFMANDGVTGVELWKTDGTSQGTVRLSNHTPTDFDFTGLRGVWSQGALHFWGDDDELWRSDGTTQGTQRVSKLANYTLGGLGFDTRGGGLDLEGTLFFSANDGEGERLWRTDGTSGGTVAVGGSTSFWSPRYLTRFGRKLLMGAATDAATGERFLWSLDASAQAPQQLGPMDFGINDDRPVVTAGALAFFTNYSFEGDSLWRTDGTPGGTLRLRQVSLPSPGWRPRLLTALGSRVFFTGSTDWRHEELWTSDGTVNGTVRVTGLDAPDKSVTFDHLIAMNGRLYFWATTETQGRALWTSDGTAAGTRLLGSVPSKSWKKTGPTNTAILGSTLFFTAEPQNGPPELWKSDGGAPMKVRAFGTNEKVLPPVQLTSFGNTLVFWADDGASGYQPWRSDGTAAGTVRVKELRKGGGTSASIPGPFTRLGATGPLVFSASDGLSGQELWRTNGTPEGTVRVADIAPGVASSAPRWFVTSGQRLYFPAWTATSGVELWAATWTAEDAEPPQVTCPAAQVVEAVNGQGAPVSYPPATATDPGETPMVAYSHASGGTFALGATEVRVTATDSGGNVATCAFTVTVRDTTPPALECPPAQSATATSAAGVAVEWPEAMASDTVSAAVTVAYAPARGSVFSVGTTEVQATATDTSGNSRSCTFEVRVQAASRVDGGTPDGGSTVPDGGSTVPDAGSQGADAGSQGPDAGSPGTSPPPPPLDSSGCGCQQSGGAGTGLLGLALLALLANRRVGGAGRPADRLHEPGGGEGLSPPPTSRGAD